MIAMRIVGLVNGAATPFDGEFLVEYDPERDGWSPEGEKMTAHIVTTSDIAKARHFPGAMEMWECWRQVCQREPRRLDGKPNRPLTAFSVETVRV